MHKTILVTITLIFIGQIQNLRAQPNDYFQQNVNYKINVELDDASHFLHGDITIKYTNNSPDQLDFIWFHLWPNAYKNNETALAEQNKYYPTDNPGFDQSHKQGYIDSLQFTVNGAAARLVYDTAHIDMAKVILPRPVKSGETITIRTPFRVKIPHGSISRFGHIGQAYNITQWYPKPAVYDHKGWHAFPYLDMGEFYSEFGSFDVHITLPKNYVVAATGNLQTQPEINRLNELARQTAAGNISDYSHTPVSSDSIKTLHYTEKNVHDFAWFADKTYRVLKDSVKLPNTGKKVYSWAFFRSNQANRWRKAPGYINDALMAYSKWYGDYPYNHCTAIQNPPGARGSGMEYPTITAIGYAQFDFMLEMVIMHEVGHNWFYGILGFNERAHPWLDEGINTFSEIRYMHNKYGDSNIVAKASNPTIAKLSGIKIFPYSRFHKYQYIGTARDKSDQPATLHSEEFRGRNYSSIVYSKTGIAFNMLKAYLGEAEFNEIMQQFFENWQYKHPYPEDLEKAFRKQASKDVSWFFESALSTKKTDYKVKKYKNNKLLVKNKGNGAMPLPVSGLTRNKTEYTRWYDGFTGEKWLKLPDTTVDVLKIDHYNQTLDINAQNHRIKTKGLFKKLEPLSLHHIGILEEPEYTQINFLPAAGYNYYNTMMLGLYLHSSYHPEQLLTWNIIPMYSIETDNLSGEGNITYTYHAEDRFYRKLKIEAAGKRYAYMREPGHHYNRFKLRGKMYFNRAGTHNRIYNSVELKGIVATDMADILATPDHVDYKPFINVKYNYSNYEQRSPIRGSIKVEGSDDFIKSAVNLNYRLRIFEDRSKQIKFNLFGGVFLDKYYVASPYYFHISSASGVEDYTYDHTFIGRFENPLNPNSQQFLSQQMMTSDGGFPTYTPFGRTDNWLLTFSTTTPVPYLSDYLPVKLYGNIATYNDPVDYSGYSQESIAWETGVKLSFAELLDVYFPALMSHFMNKYNNDITDNYWQKIRFSLHLNKLANEIN